MQVFSYPQFSLRLGFQCHTLFESCGLILNSYKDCFVLHQGCHSLSNIAQASIQQLMDCSLDQETAKKVYNFFHSLTSD